MRLTISLLSWLLPWRLRRHLLQRAFGYTLHPTARIGYALLLGRSVVLGAHAAIGHFTVVRGVDILSLGDYSQVGRLNWITATPTSDTVFYRDQSDRAPSLILGDHSSITNRHLIDCSATIRIGQFTTVAGFRSQLLTHSIDLAASEQRAFPIDIGDYCFIGTGCILLGNSSLPSYSVLGAASLLNRRHTQQYVLYGGVPAVAIRSLDRNMRYFHRNAGFVT